MGIARTFLDCLRLRYHDGMSPRRIDRFQSRMLRRAVRHAQRRSEFYRELYRGIDPDDPAFSVEQLPTVSKEALMANFDRLATDPRLKLAEVQQWARDKKRIGQRFLGRYVVTHASGTTGTPALFVYDRREWDMIQALGVTRGMRYKPGFFELLRHTGRVLRHHPRISLLSVLGGHFVTYLLFLVTPGMARRLARFQFLSVTEPLEEVVEKLNSFSANILHIYPTMLEVLAYEKLEGRLHIDPWAISTSSEPMTRNAARVIRRAFPRTLLFETYGTTEGVTLACGCSAGDGMHVNSDYYILEPVHEDNTPVEPGEAGDKLLVSCLFCRTMPLLRYELTDVTIPVEGACSCGLPFPRIRVRGRSDDIFWVLDADGQPVALPPIPLEALLLETDGLRQYQVVQQERNFLRVLFIPLEDGQAENLTADITRRFRSFLADKGLAEVVRLSVERVQQIEREPRSGKIRQIFSKVERLYLPGVPLGERRSGDDRRTRSQISQEGERRRRARRLEEDEK